MSCRIFPCLMYAPLILEYTTSQLSYAMMVHQLYTKAEQSYPIRNGSINKGQSIPPSSRKVMRRQLHLPNGWQTFLFIMPILSKTSAIRSAGASLIFASSIGQELLYLESILFGNKTPAWVRSIIRTLFQCRSLFYER